MIITREQALELVQQKRAALLERTKEDVAKILDQIEKLIRKAVEEASSNKYDIINTVRYTFDEAMPNATFILDKVVDILRAAGWTVEIKTEGENKNTIKISSLQI